MTPFTGDPPTEPFLPVTAPRDALLHPAETITGGFRVRLFGSHAYFRMWIAQVVSSLGDWVGLVAITSIAARIGGSSAGAATSLVLSARIVPGLFLSQVVAVMVDRLDRKRVMVVCDVVRGLVWVSLPFIESVWGLFVVSLFLELGQLAWASAKEASVPRLVPQEHLTTVNSLSVAAAYGTFPIGTIVFALLAKLAQWLGNWSPLDFLKINQQTLAVYLNVLTFFTSAILIYSLPLLHERGSAKADGKRVDVGQVFREIREGWHFIFVNPLVRAVMVALGTGLIGGGMLVPLGQVHATEVLRGGPPAYSLLLSSLGFGMAAGVLAVSALQRRLPKTLVFNAAVLMAGVSLFLAAAMSTLALAMLFVFGVGIGAGTVYVLGFTLLHESVDDELRGRIFATLYTLVRLCVLIAFAIAPLLSDALDRLSNRWFHRRIHLGVSIGIPGVRLTLWLAGLIIVAAGLLSVATIRRGVAQDKVEP